MTLGLSGLSVSALLLWMQGFPDRALERANDAVALATQAGSPVQYGLCVVSYRLAPPVAAGG